jgi:hypothetical protein
MGTNFKILALIAVLLFAGVAFADRVELHYSQIAAAPTVTHDAVSSVDTTVVAASDPEPLDDHWKATKGNPKVTAKVQFSNSGATGTVTCYLWHQSSGGDWTFLGATDAALTADTQLGEDSTYTATAMPEFDTRGATHYEIRLTVLSAGSVTITPYAYGSNTDR